MPIERLLQPCPADGDMPDECFEADDDLEFAFGLDLILDGFERLRAQ